MRRSLVMVVVTALVALAVSAASSTPASSVPVELRMNDIQVKGSHNSYHVEQPPEVIDFYASVVPTAYQLAYSHDDLTTQLTEQGVRQFELDTWYDPTGTLFEPIGTPGFKVLHVETIDEDTRCQLLTDCLTEIETWSAANPGHVPITILLEMKGGDEFPGGKVPPDITAAALHELDTTIRSVIDESDMVTPDFIRGVGRVGGADGGGTVYDDPESAVLGFGWPMLDDVRGRMMFVLDNERTDYVDGDPTLAGRVAFPPSSPGNPDAAFIKLNDAVADHDDIVDAVEAGYMVRTRADYPVDTGLTGDDTDRLSALESGAHFISGDYLTSTDYARYNAVFAARFDLPFNPNRPAYRTFVDGGTPARCNPRTAPPGCTSWLVEDLPTCVTPFWDVGVTHAFCDDIEWAAREQVANGFADGSFRPTNTSSRQAIAAFFYRLAGEPSFTPPLTPTFSDVPTNHAFYLEIEWLVAEGIGNGYPDGTFRPTATVTRQAISAFFYRLAGEPSFTPPGTPTFSDVPDAHPFFAEIEWLAEEEVAGGFADGTFRPGNTVTRQATAAFAHRFVDGGLLPPP
jgi:hypothetical protein